MSRPPNCLRTSSSRRSTDASSATSASTAVAWSPIAAATSSWRPVMSARITRAPSAANFSAVARPIPEPAPVTSAVLPSSRPANSTSFPWLVLTLSTLGTPAAADMGRCSRSPRFSGTAGSVQLDGPLQRDGLHPRRHLFGQGVDGQLVPIRCGPAAALRGDQLDREGGAEDRGRPRDGEGGPARRADPEAGAGEGGGDGCSVRLPTLERGDRRGVELTAPGGAEQDDRDDRLLLPRPRLPGARLLARFLARLVLPRYARLGKLPLGSGLPREGDRRGGGDEAVAGGGVRTPHRIVADRRVGLA